MAEVSEFQAAFQTTFSQRWRGMSSRTVNFVPPVVRRVEKVDRRSCSVEDEGERVEGKRPICMSSLLVWLTYPGEVWVAPVHVCFFPLVLEL